jgi:hypothetical protein
LHASLEIEQQARSHFAGQMARGGTTCTIPSLTTSPISFEPTKTAIERSFSDFYAERASRVGSASFSMLTLPFKYAPSSMEIR